MRKTCWELPIVGLPKKSTNGSDKQLASTSDLVTSSDVGQAGSKPGSARVRQVERSLLEEELHDPELEEIKRKVAQRAQFNPLQPPNYVPPSKGPPWGMWVAIGAVAVVVLGRPGRDRASH